MHQYQTTAIQQSQVHHNSCTFVNPKTLNSFEAMQAFVRSLVHPQLGLFFD